MPLHTGLRTHLSSSVAFPGYRYPSRMGRAWALGHCRGAACLCLVRILPVLVSCHRRFGWILRSFDLEGVYWQLRLYLMVEKEVLVGGGLSSGRSWEKLFSTARHFGYCFFC